MLLLKVLVPKNPEFMGKMVEVDVYEAGKHFLKGQPASDARIFTPSVTRPLAKGEVSGLTEVSRRQRRQWFSCASSAVHNNSKFCSSYFILFMYVMSVFNIF